MFNSQFLNTIILLGAIQGLIFSSLLWFSKTKLLYNRLLSVLIFLVSLANLKIYFINQNWFNNTYASVIFDVFIPLIIMMPAGPLVFFYTKSLLNPDYRLSKNDRRQFYLIILDILPNLIGIVYVVLLFFHLIRNTNQSMGEFLDDYNNYVDIPRWIGLSSYIYFSHKYLNRQTASWKNSATPKQQQSLAWAKQFLLGITVFQTLWLIHLVPYVIPKFSGRLIDWGNWYPLYIPLSILIYWLGIKGYLMSQKLAVQQKKKINKPGGLSDSAISQISETLTRSMKEKKLYLNPDLSLTQLSAETGFPQKVISEVLNQHLHKNFNEFVNEYRINEIIDRILQPESKLFTITSIAFDCGFNSQPTFQRAFKSIIGLSPSAFLSQNQSKSSFKPI